MQFSCWIHSSVTVSESQAFTYSPSSVEMNLKAEVLARYASLPRLIRRSRLEGGGMATFESVKEDIQGRYLGGPIHGYDFCQSLPTAYAGTAVVPIVRTTHSQDLGESGNQVVETIHVGDPVSQLAGRPSSGERVRACWKHEDGRPVSCVLQNPPDQTTIASSPDRSSPLQRPFQRREGVVFDGLVCLYCMYCTIQYNIYFVHGRAIEQVCRCYHGV